jgi:ribosome-binding factor A
MNRHSKSGGDRATRVAEQIHQELAQLIAREVKDPRIGMVTLTSVDITADYAYATVHFTVMPSDDETVARTLEGLRRSAGFMRSQMGRRVRIHTNPQLRFVHDRSVEHGVDMSRLIDQANAVRAADDGLDAGTAGGTEAASDGPSGAVRAGE